MAPGGPKHRPLKEGALDARLMAWAPRNSALLLVRRWVTIDDARFVAGFQWVLAVEAVIGELVSDAGIPCLAGKYREILPLETGDGDQARASANKFRAFPTNSLRIATGNFAD